MSKIDPIIKLTLPKYVFKKGEMLLPANPKTPTKDFTIVGNFYVTDTGRLFELKGTIVEELPGHLDSYGYRVVKLPCSDGKKHELKMHRLVMCSFFPRPDMNKKEVNHKKGKQKANNNIKNLEWLSHGDNIRDAIKQGLKEKISDKDIKKVIELAKAGYSDDYISKKVHRAEGTVLQIRTGNGEYAQRLKDNKLEPVRAKRYIRDEEFPLIYNLIDRGYSDIRIASLIGGSEKTISDIRIGNGDYYKQKLEEHNRKPLRKLAKITNDTIRYIFKAAEEGLSDKEIADSIGSGEGTVQAIRSGQVQYIERITKLGFKPIKTGGNEITDNALRLIIDMARAGRSDKEISLATGVPASSVKTARQGRSTYAKRLEKLGLEPVLLRVRKPFMDDDYRELIRLAREGVSDEELGAIFGRTPKGIQAIRIGQDKNGEILARLGLEPVRTCTRVRKR